MPEEHPQCPVCGSYDTKEIMLKGNEVPEQFFASTDYKCNDCDSIWISGDYVTKVGQPYKDMVKNSCG